MGETTKIEYARATWSPWIGCQHAGDHPGCEFCYAEQISGRFGVTWGPDGTRRLNAPHYWKRPLNWNRKAAKEGGRFIVFPSMCDPFEDFRGPVVDHYGNLLHRNPDDDSRHAYSPTFPRLTIADVRLDFYRLIGETPNLTWTLFTKRPENIRRMLPLSVDFPVSEESPKVQWPNVWLVYSASDQASLERGVNAVVDTNDLVPVRGLSLEPLLGLIDLVPYLQRCDGTPAIQWVIVGGETGSRARPCRLEWIADIVEQCRAAGVPVFVKQTGAFTYVENPGPWTWGIPPISTKWCGDSPMGCRLELRTHGGGRPEEWPAEIRVREYPKG